MQEQEISETRAFVTNMLEPDEKIHLVDSFSMKSIEAVMRDSGIAVAFTILIGLGLVWFMTHYATNPGLSKILNQILFVLVMLGLLIPFACALQAKKMRLVVTSLRMIILSPAEKKFPVGTFTWQLLFKDIVSAEFIETGSETARTLRLHLSQDRATQQHIRRLDLNGATSPQDIAQHLVRAAIPMRRALTAGKVER